jgi:PhnB protein
MQFLSAALSVPRPASRPSGITQAEDMMPLGTDKAAILKLLDDVRKAHQEKNAAKIMSNYNKDAVIFDLPPPLLSPLGTDAKAVQGWLDTWDGPVEQASRDIEITVSSNTAFCHGLLELSGVAKMAGRQIRLWMRATFCFARQGDGWKIVHEHTSVPFYMDGSFRAARDLEP